MLIAYTTGSAVANFFTPISKKPKERILWNERASDNDSPATLLVAKYTPEPDSETSSKQTNSENKKRTKIAAFDLVWAC